MCLSLRVQTSGPSKIIEKMPSQYIHSSSESTSFLSFPWRHSPGASYTCVSLGCPPLLRALVWQLPETSPHHPDLKTGQQREEENQKNQKYQQSQHGGGLELATLPSHTLDYQAFPREMFFGWNYEASFYQHFQYNRGHGNSIFFFNDYEYFYLF